CVEPFGDFEKHTIQTSNQQTGFSVVPAYGNCVLGVWINGVQLLDGYTTPAELTQMSFSKNVWLFPFPNRLAGGYYQYEGNNYQFPINDKSGPNSIHGIGRKVKHQLLNVNLSNEQGTISTLYQYNDEHEYYPFSFDLFLHLTMNPAGFDVAVIVENKSPIVMPFGFGWHPYFKFSSPLEKVKIQLPICKEVLVDNNMIPTGEKVEYEKFSSLKDIEDTHWDTCFVLCNLENKNTLPLLSETGLLSYYQNESCPYFQLFTPQHRQSIAIEPMSCNINAFNNGEGLIQLQPNQNWQAKFGFNWKSSY
ncbi:MAG: aldose 1-epimerase, partial [Saprospiraceae bacterium]